MNDFFSNNKQEAIQMFKEHRLKGGSSSEAFKKLANHYKKHVSGIQRHFQIWKLEDKELEEVIKNNAKKHKPSVVKNKTQKIATNGVEFFTPTKQIVKNETNENMSTEEKNRQYRSELTPSKGIKIVLELLENQYSKREVVEWLSNEFKIGVGTVYYHLKRYCKLNKTICMAFGNAQEKQIFKSDIIEPPILTENEKTSHSNDIIHVDITRPRQEFEQLPYKKPEFELPYEKSELEDLPIEKPEIIPVIPQQHAYLNDFSAVLRVYAQYWHKPDQKEIEGLQETFIHLVNREIDAVLWMTTAIKEISKKHPDKQEVRYLIGLLRNRMKYGWGVSRSEEEDTIIKEIEKKTGKPLEWEHRSSIYKLMSDHGSLRIIMGIYNLDITSLYLRALTEYLKENDRPEVRKQLNNTIDWEEVIGQ